VHIEFDVNKNDTNIRERDLSLERASDFDFDSAIIKRDLRRPYPEVRYVAVGFFGCPLAYFLLHAD
jgi:hypothetical protein